MATYIGQAKTAQRRMNTLIDYRGLLSTAQYRMDFSVYTSAITSCVCDQTIYTLERHRIT